VTINTAPIFILPQGVVIQNWGSKTDNAKSLAVQVDGKILVTGSSALNGLDAITVSRYDENGSPDRGFGNNGVLIFNAGKSWSSGTDIFAQPDGKILILSTTSSFLHPYLSGPTVIRLNSDGSIDTSFGENGVSRYIFQSVNSDGTSLAVQSDGKILVSAGTYENGVSAGGIIRLNQDGILDKSFGTNGQITASIGSYGTSIRSIALQEDGRIIAVGQTRGANWGESNFAVFRFNNNGSLDTSFSGDGKVRTAFEASRDVASSVTIQPDGKIIVAGYTGSSGNETFAIARYTANGSLDNTFDVDGKVTTAFRQGFIQRVVLQDDGKILVAGLGYDRNQAIANLHGPDVALARYLPNGSLDLSFGTGGTVLTDFALGYENGTDIWISSGGKILVVGNTYSPTDADSNIALFRYLENGDPDQTFFNRPSTLTYVTGSPATVLLGEFPSIKITDTELSNKNNYGGSVLSLARKGIPSNADEFSAGNKELDHLYTGGELNISGFVIGTVLKNSGGELRILFNSSATENLISRVIKSIAYKNTSSIASTIELEWTFDDGNTGSQGSGGSLKATFASSISISIPNSAPVASSGLGATSEDVQLKGSLNSATDKDGDTVAYVKVGDPSNGAVSVSSDGTYTYTPRLNFFGTDSFSFKVTDGKSDSAIYTQTITISAINDSPVVANTLPDQVVRVGASVSFTVPVTTFRDVDNPTLIYSAKLVSGAALPSWLIFDTNTRTFSGAPTSSNIGTLSITVIASDGSLSAFDTFDLVINAAIPLVIAGTSASDTLSGGAGNDIIDGGAGTDTALYLGPASRYVLFLSTTGHQLEDKGGLEGRDSLIDIERIKFSDRTVNIESRKHSGFGDIPATMYQFFILAFGAAPGVEYLQQCADAYRAGADVKRITNVFTTKTQFTDTYPTSLSNRELATKLVGNVVGSSATQEAKAEAINDITLAMNNGLGVGDMIFTVFNNLAGKKGDATWGGTAQLFFNQIAVAKYYTEVLNQSTTDRATLASAISMVKADSDVSTEAAIVTLIGQGLLGG
jgi:uncharacterized delta-60 repeat protein